MRAKLMSKREEHIIQVYLETGEMLQGFGMIKHRFLKSGYDVAVADRQARLLQKLKERLERE